MNDAQRLAQLIDELLSNPGYLDGRRRFPRTVTPDDALRIAGMLQDEIDAGTDARAGAARTRGLHIACAAGCNACCEQPIIVYLPEVIRIAAWLARPENAAVRGAFLERYPAWRERAADHFDAITHARDDEAARDAHLAQWQRRLRCAFNDAGGKCSIYPVRPIVCRLAHALDSDERCHAESFDGRLPVAMSYPPVERAGERARAILKALHHALGGEKNRRMPLCRGVAERLPPVV
jgi:Fe-S-cluster containining protein